MEIREKIREWYLLNKRLLPWRDISDPYRIWVSEIILQQTRVNQGMDYYFRFLEAFPDIESLALAPENEVLKVWEGLGYYSRARNMQAAARYIYYDLKGKFPDSYTDLIKMKGVGPYTAAAVSSISFNEPRAVVDGNVHRVISRLFGIEEVASGYKASSRILAEASALLDEEDPGTHNQAVMELGALVCKPSSPDCSSCPVQEDCFAYRKDRIADFPKIQKKTPGRRRYFHYLVISDGESIWLGRRQKRDIWQGLYEFPLIETRGPRSLKSLVNSEEWKALLGEEINPSGNIDGINSPKVWGPVKHVLSHQDIIAKFYRIDESDNYSLKGFEKVRINRMNRYPLPKLILKYLEA